MLYSDEYVYHSSGMNQFAYLTFIRCLCLPIAITGQMYRISAFIIAMQVIGITSFRNTENIFLCINKNPVYQILSKVKDV